MTENVRIVIVTGPAGSGKTTAIRALEDLGYFCIDNLPAALLPGLLELRKGVSELEKIALVMDMREGKFLSQAPRVIEQVEELGYPIEILFLECDDKVIVRRFSETRRPHPLAGQDGDLKTGIRKERELLQPLKERADLILNTTRLIVHDLRAQVQDQFRKPGTRHQLLLHIVSFGHRVGPPDDAEILMDVRFLPNPNYIAEMRDKNGLDEDVANYVLKHEVTQKFMERFCEMLDFLIPHYVAEGKSYLTLGIGCTGGQHRSVAIAQEIARRISDEAVTVRLQHRDLEHGKE